MRSSPDRRIDLNADVGEGAGEAPLFAIISSANIACGGHAGDAESMRASVALAQRHAVAIGAHPGYPDRARFGRVTLPLGSDALAKEVGAQTAALVRVAADAGGTVMHVKPHGALYNDSAESAEIASAIARGVVSVSDAIALVGLAGSAALHVWRERGFVVAAEGFADRAYDAGGRLVPRTSPGALITDPRAASDQAVRLASEGMCETICIHSDTPGAIAIAQAVRSGLERAGFVIRSLAPG